MKKKNPYKNFEKIPSKEIWKVWIKYWEKYFIELECPYCFTYSHILYEEDSKLHLRKCACEIPKIPTPKYIKIRLTRKQHIQ